MSISYYDWIVKAYIGQSSHKGYMVDRMMNDPKFPRSESNYFRIINYLIINGAEGEELRTAKNMHKNYIRAITEQGLSL